MKLNHNKKLKTHDLPVYTMEDWIVQTGSTNDYTVEELSKR